MSEIEAFLIDRVQAKSTGNQFNFARALAAFRRIETLSNHLRNSLFESHGEVKGSDGLRVTEVEELEHSALVPLPGTFEHDSWLLTLSRHSPDSRAVGVLKEWTRGFAASGSRMSRALRRIRLIGSHLTRPLLPPIQPVI